MRFVHAHPPTLPHPDVDAFYRRYAPPLWGLLVLAHLPASQSETILINTLLKAWQQQQKGLPNTQSFAQILQIAYQEGLPITPLVASVIRLVHASPDSRS